MGEKTSQNDGASAGLEDAAATLEELWIRYVFESTLRLGLISDPTRLGSEEAPF